jgi:hypothetical protein
MTQQRKLQQKILFDYIANDPVQANKKSHDRQKCSCIAGNIQIFINPVINFTCRSGSRPTPMAGESPPYGYVYGMVQ